MSRRYSDSSGSGSGSDTKEGSEKSHDFFEIRRNRKKLGAQFFTDSNSSGPSISSSSSHRGTKVKLNNNFNPNQKTTAPAGVSVSRSRAAIWPSVSDTEDTDPDASEKNNNPPRQQISLKNEEILKKSGSLEATGIHLSDELATVTEQLQIIQMTQELILSELRSDVESLQTENLCLQHHNTRLRVQVDHLNELVFELSKELNLMREFVRARDGNSSSPTKPDSKTKNKKIIEKTSSRPSSAPQNCDSQISELKLSSRKKELKEKMKEKHESKKEKNKCKKEKNKVDNVSSDEASPKRSGFFSSLFRSRKPKPERRRDHSRSSSRRSSRERIRED